MGCGKEESQILMDEDGFEYRSEEAEDLVLNLFGEILGIRICA